MRRCRCTPVTLKFSSPTTEWSRRTARTRQLALTSSSRGAYGDRRRVAEWLSTTSKVRSEDWTSGVLWNHTAHASHASATTPDHAGDGDDQPTACRAGGAVAVGHQVAHLTDSRIGPVPRMVGMLRLMHVHAHPDDESSKGAASTVKYVKEGVDVHVVTCTGGERGSILNPKMDRPEVLENITEIRRQEMDAAREILGVRQDWLGLRRLRLARGRPEAAAARGLLRADGPEVAAEPLVRLIRSFRPHVLTTYDENGGYPHPDHIQCHNVSMVAFEAAGDPDRFPDAGRAVAAAEALLPPRLQPAAHAGAARRDARGAAWSRRTPSGWRSGSRTPPTTRGSPPGCRAASTSRSATRR